jgi:phospholipase D1/2
MSPCFMDSILGPNSCRSTVVGDIKVENRIGDALVHRIIRAHREGTPWKCCIVIPLLPGFAFPVDHADASAVRLRGL